VALGPVAITDVSTSSGSLLSGGTLEASAPLLTVARAVSNPPTIKPRSIAFFFVVMPNTMVEDRGRVTPKMSRSRDTANEMTSVRLLL
jgi:hypothetical protein